jgi:hypothetical protein
VIASSNRVNTYPGVTNAECKIRAGEFKCEVRVIAIVENAMDRGRWSEPDRVMQWPFLSRDPG